MNKPVFFSCICMLLSSSVFAEDKRDLDAHEHGVAQLGIAVEGQAITMEFEIPGADIVGFEHKPTKDSERLQVSEAIAALKDISSVIEIPANAGCKVTASAAELHGHSEHGDEGGHAEFHAEYALNCKDVKEVSGLAFSYFETFPNAEEIEVQLVTERGASKFEVFRSKPRIELPGTI